MKTHNPICPYDRKECICDMESYLNCHECERFHNGVRETGGLPDLEFIINQVKTLFKCIIIKPKNKKFLQKKDK